MKDNQITPGVCSCTASLFIGFLWQSCLFCYLMHIVNQCTHKLAKLDHIQYGKTWIVKESVVKKK